MPVKIQAQIEKIALGSGDSVKVRWSRDTGELAYGPNFPDRTKWRDEWAILVRNKNPKDGLRIYLRPGSKIRIRLLHDEKAAAENLKVKPDLKAARKPPGKS
jgi:hypothetical protein